MRSGSGKRQVQVVAVTVHNQRTIQSVPRNQLPNPECALSEQSVKNMSGCASGVHVSEYDKSARGMRCWYGYQLLGLASMLKSVFGWIPRPPALDSDFSFVVAQTPTNSPVKKTRHTVHLFHSLILKLPNPRPKLKPL